MTQKKTVLYEIDGKTFTFSERTLGDLNHYDVYAWWREQAVEFAKTLNDPKDAETRQAMIIAANNAPPESARIYSIAVSDPRFIRNHVWASYRVANPNATREQFDRDVPDEFLKPIFNLILGAEGADDDAKKKATAGE